MTDYTEREFTKQLIAIAKQADDGYFDYAAIIARRLPKRLHEQLWQLINGPVWDGDVIDKSDRSELFYYGLAVRVCHKGEPGYTGAPYIAYTVMKTADEIRKGIRG